MDIKTYARHNFRKIPQMEIVDDQVKRDIEIVSHILPFKVNNYVIENLINWDDIPNDPIFTLTFPRRDLLSNNHYAAMEEVLQNNISQNEQKKVIEEIRQSLNPHPANQENNIPTHGEKSLEGIQHKYRETLLFFPTQGQTCHAYCTFCFRWPQFVAMDGIKFASKESHDLVKYVKDHPNVTDVLFTGGDPMVMRTNILESYINPLLDDHNHQVQNIRIGTKSLTYWPYRFTHDRDADDLLRLFEKVVKRGKHLAIMAHFNHPRELSTPVVEKAIEKIRSTGAEIRTQSPILGHINDKASDWSDMWKRQVQLGLIPYYMFVERNTGAKAFFEVPLQKTFDVYTKAFSNVSGICRTVRGPSMSTDPGKVHILGTSVINGEKVFVLRFLQARDPEWVGKPFYAKYDPHATWLDDLTPAFGKKEFFFQ